MKVNIGDFFTYSDTKFGKGVVTITAVYSNHYIATILHQRTGWHLTHNYFKQHFRPMKNASKIWRELVK